MRIEGKTADGRTFSGRVLALGREEVSFELPGSEPCPVRSEAVTHLAVKSDALANELGTAKVLDIVDTGVAVYCRARYTAEAATGRAPLNGAVQADVAGHCARFVSLSRMHRRIQPAYRMAVLDIEDFLTEFETFLITLGPHVNGEEAGFDVAEEPSLDLIRQKVTPILNTLFESFEDAASRIPASEVAVHSSYAMSRLHRHLLGSPFQWRIYRKPLGYAGDYEMVNMILRQRYEGRSASTRILHRWLVGQVLAEAHRNRVGLLARRLIEVRAVAVQRHGTFRAFSLGCGPAGEVEMFLKSPGPIGISEFTLVDFDDETLAVTESRLRSIQRTHAPRAQLRLLKRSAVQFLRSSGREFAESQDLVYCAGLFDYLADGVCVPLLRAFHDMLRIGGRLIVTNVQLPNPMHGVMTHLFDWHLECRDAARMRSLWGQAGLDSEPWVYVDDTAGNVFLEVVRDA